MVLNDSSVVYVCLFTSCWIERKAILFKNSMYNITSYLLNFIMNSKAIQYRLINSPSFQFLCNCCTFVIHSFLWIFVPILLFIDNKSLKECACWKLYSHKYQNQRIRSQCTITGDAVLLIGKVDSFCFSCYVVNKQIKKNFAFFLIYLFSLVILYTPKYFKTCSFQWHYLNALKGRFLTT